MNFYFADTSAFAKRYVPEIGSKWVQSWIEPEFGNVIFIADLGRVEFTSLLSRRRRDKSIEATAFTRLQEDFLLHARYQYRVIGATSTVLTFATRLADRQTLRALDAIQLASAIMARSLLQTAPTFVSADDRLLAIAAQEGFIIENPNWHP